MRHGDLKCAPHPSQTESVVGTYKWWGIGFNSYTVLCIGNAIRYYALVDDNSVRLFQLKKFIGNCCFHKINPKLFVYRESDHCSLRSCPQLPQPVPGHHRSNELVSHNKNIHVIKHFTICKYKHNQLFVFFLYIYIVIARILFLFVERVTLHRYIKFVNTFSE